MLALFSPPVLLFDKCAFVCTLIQYISRFATCQANFSCKLRETQRKFQPATGYLYPSRWLRLSDDVATATTEMERSGIEVAVLVLMPESFRSCGDSHTSMQRQRNRSSLACQLNLSFQPHRLPYLYQISIQIIEAHYLFFIPHFLLPLLHYSEAVLFHLAHKKQYFYACCPRFF